LDAALQRDAGLQRDPAARDVRQRSEVRGERERAADLTRAERGQVRAPLVGDGQEGVGAQLEVLAAGTFARLRRAAAELDEADARGCTLRERSLQREVAQREIARTREREARGEAELRRAAQRARESVHGPGLAGQELQRRGEARELELLQRELAVTREAERVDAAAPRGGERAFQREAARRTERTAHAERQPERSRAFEAVEVDLELDVAQGRVAVRTVHAHVPVGETQSHAHVGYAAFVRVVVLSGGAGPRLREWLLPVPAPVGRARDVDLRIGELDLGPDPAGEERPELERGGELVQRGE